MSRELSKKRAELMQSFFREISRFSTWTVIYHQAVAVKLGLNPTDLKSGTILSYTGPLTAGELAEKVGLTTGAITGVIDRLEKIGFVRRERDPHDRRRVIVRLVEEPENLARIEQMMGSLAESGYEFLAKYTDEELALIVDFVIRGHGVMEAETARLRKDA